MVPQLSDGAKWRPAMAITATISHNGLIWAVVPEEDLPHLVGVLSAGLGTVEFTANRDDHSEEWRVLEAMLVEPDDEDKLDFRLQGRLLAVTGRRSALAELASALSDLAADPKEYPPGCGSFG